jgi:hypothetical protein
MLKVASFPITDAKSINELLTKYRLAGGMHILVSEGHVCIPYEDGSPENNDQKRAALGEQRNTTIRERDIIVLAQAGLQRMIKDASDRLDAIRAGKPDEKALRKADARAEYDAKEKQAQNVLNQLCNQHLSNIHELARFDINIQCVEEAIAALA